MSTDRLDNLVQGTRISEFTPKTKSGRRLARIISVQSLYEFEMTGIDTDVVSSRLLAKRSISKGDQRLAKQILKTVNQNLNYLDEKISKAATKFDISEMSSIDRNTLRMAVSETLLENAPPKPVIINEAIEVASYLGSDSSGSLINGVLVTLLM